MKRARNNSRGLSLLETLVAISIAMSVFFFASINIKNAEQRYQTMQAVSDFEEIHMGLLSRTLYQDLPPSDTNSLNGWGALGKEVSLLLRKKYIYKCSSGSAPIIQLGNYPSETAYAVKARLEANAWCAKNGTLTLQVDNPGVKNDLFSYDCKVINYDRPLLGSTNRPCL